MISHHHRCYHHHRGNRYYRCYLKPSSLKTITITAKKELNKIAALLRYSYSKYPLTPIMYHSRQKKLYASTNCSIFFLFFLQNYHSNVGNDNYVITFVIGFLVLEILIHWHHLKHWQILFLNSYELFFHLWKKA